MDEDALIEALETEQIAGAALDVFSEEPLLQRSSVLVYEKCNRHSSSCWLQRSVRGQALPIVVAEY